MFLIIETIFIAIPVQADKKMYATEKLMQTPVLRNKTYSLFLTKNVAPHMTYANITKNCEIQYSISISMLIITHKKTYHKKKLLGNPKKFNLLFFNNFNMHIFQKLFINCVWCIAQWVECIFHHWERINITNKFVMS